MPAKSKAQQRFMGMVHGLQKGTINPSDVSNAVKKVAKTMKKKSAKDYASTKHTGKPEKVNEMPNFGRGTSGLPKGFTDDYYKIVKKLSKGKGYLTLSKSDKKKVWATLGKIYTESVKEERDYKDEYKKFQSSSKSKKYRAELNQYNRKKGTYGNNDGKDASHKGGKIVGFEAESKNRGRAEKSRLKKEGKEYKPEKRRKLKTGEVEIMKGKGNRQKWFYLKNQNDVKQLIRLGRNSAFPTGITKNNSRVKFDKNLHIKESVKGASIFEAKFTDDTLAPRIKHWASKHKGTGIGYGHVLGQLAIHMKEMGWNKSYKEVARIAMELGRKKKVESVNEELYNSQGEQTDFKKGDLVKDINPDCPHVGSEGEVTKVGNGTITFKVTNNGKTYQEGDELEKTVDQMVKIKESVR
jgi:hypothetical protein